MSTTVTDLKEVIIHTHLNNKRSYITFVDKKMKKLSEEVHIVVDGLSTFHYLLRMMTERGRKLQREKEQLKLRG